MSLPFVIGDRVVVRYRLPDGRATDALGVLLELDDSTALIETKRGPERVSLADVLLAKTVPPAVARAGARFRLPPSPPPE